MAEGMTAVLAVLERVSALIRSFDDQTVVELAAGRLVLTVQRAPDRPVLGADVAGERTTSPPAPESVPRGRVGTIKDGSTVVAGQPDSASVRQRLDEMGSREEAHMFLEGIARNKQILQRIGRDLGVRVSLGRRRDEMIDMIVNSAVGVRLDQDGIGRRVTSL
ncbi:hypothetical protein E0F15_16805 [Frankia sp. B2]|uniref:hypothetical protein n=1 Tax=Frankia sp. B2 TaxID=2541730 RepID=UPI0010693BD0|nr:hypothetical protein [Frankia sp. B2]TFE27066.1 hypothetical protein E0F15_16805 [Frankia sp. B2]